MKDEAIKRLFARWKVLFEAPRLATTPWWSTFVDDLQPDDLLAVRGPWLLQRQILALFIAGFGRDDEVTLRGPSALLEEVIEEALTLRAGLLRKRVRIGFLDNSNWEALAVAAGATVGAGFKVQSIDGIDGIELESTARWYFGMHAPHPDVEIKVGMERGNLCLDILDGRWTPPRRRRLRVKRGHLHVCGDDGYRFLAGDNDDDLE